MKIIRVVNYRSYLIPIDLHRYWWNKFKTRVVEQFKVVVVGLAYLIDGLVTIVSLGFLATDLVPWVLFDLFVEDRLPTRED